VFVDLKKAFDTVWHDALMFKISQKGISGNFLNVIRSMYSCNQSAIKINEKRSEYFQCNQGVRQGDGISPMLFNIFVDDLPRLFQKDICNPITLGGLTVGSLMYADDLVILSRSPEGIQHSLTLLSMYCKKWNLTVSVSKTKSMTFFKKVQVKFTFEKQPLETVKEFKYLGTIINKNGNFTCNIESLSKKALKVVHVINGLLSHSNIADIKVKLSVFDATVLPIITYGCEVWGGQIFNTNLVHPTKLVQSDRVQQKFLKRLAGLPITSTNLAVLLEYGRYPISKIVMKQMLKYYIRLEQMHNNRLLKQIFTYYKNQNIWTNSLTKIVNEINMVDEYKNLSMLQPQQTKKLHTETHQYLDLYFDEQFYNQLHANTGTSGKGGNKLRTYSTFKTSFTQEPYLEVVKNIKMRSVMARFRISAHSLHVESGRHDKKLYKERICQFCPNNEIEDEIHLLLKCKFYHEFRVSFLEELKLYFPTLLLSSHAKQFILIMKSRETNVIEHLATFLSRCFAKRQFALMQ